MEKSLQERYAMATQCFGCGPSNAEGLRIRSFPAGDPAGNSDDTDELVADFRPAPHHLAFPGVLNGGICGVLLDCHCNWAAAWHLMRKRGAAQPPATVTAEYTVKLRRPTPVDQTLRLRARAVSSTENKVEVEGEIVAGDVVTATCRGVFVAVREGHPAFPRW